jgi:hypothetical protein
LVQLERAEKEIELIQDGGQIKREKDIYHTSVRNHFLSFSTIATPLVSHWSLPLNNNIGENGEKEALHVESLDL